MWAKFTKTSKIDDPLLQVPPARRGNRWARFPSRSGEPQGGAIVNFAGAVGIPQIPQRYHANRLREVAESPIAQTGRWKGMFSAIAIALAVACVVGAYSLLRDALDEVW